MVELFLSPASDNIRDGVIFKHNSQAEFELSVQVGSKIISYEITC